MDKVGDALIVRVCVDGGHQPIDYAERFVQHLRHRRETVRGATGVGDAHVGRAELIIIDPEHHGDIRVVLGRGAQDDLPGTGL